MLKSIGTPLERLAHAVISMYSFVFAPTFREATDTTRPTHLVELRAVTSTLPDVARLAREVMADDQFSSLNANVQDDITTIAEDLELGLSEIDAEINPDKKWLTMTQQEKLDATQHCHVDPRALRRLHARIIGELRDPNISRAPLNVNRNTWPPLIDDRGRVLLLD